MSFYVAFMPQYRINITSIVCMHQTSTKSAKFAKKKRGNTKTLNSYLDFPAKMFLIFWQRSLFLFIVYASQWNIHLQCLIIIAYLLNAAICHTCKIVSIKRECDSICFLIFEQEIELAVFQFFALERRCFDVFFCYIYV